VAKRLGGSLPYVPILEGGDQGLDGRAADVAELLGGSLARVAALATQCLDQRRDVCLGISLLEAERSEKRRGVALQGQSGMDAVACGNWGADAWPATPSDCPLRLSSVRAVVIETMPKAERPHSRAIGTFDTM
jgi:hypothetical protein